MKRGDWVGAVVLAIILAVLFFPILWFGRLLWSNPWQ